MTKPLLVPVGDPAGVGPEVAIKAALELGASERMLLIGDAHRLRQQILATAEGSNSGQPTRMFTELLDAPWRDAPTGLSILDSGAVSDGCVQARQPSREGGLAQLRSLDMAIDLVLEGKGRAIVTGPTSKEAVELSGTPFTGQTEHLARRSGLRADDVTMLFLGPRLRIALVTTHLSILDVPAHITSARVLRTIGHLDQALRALEPDRAPSLVVCGLNPHAGEGGLFGSEETSIAAAVDKSVSTGVHVMGPIASEAAYRRAVAGAADGVVAMYHDQGTIPSKLLDFGAAVNVTWGLPFLRTSVDHGVAYDAPVGQGNAEGMLAALRLAQRLVPSSRG